MRDRICLQIRGPSAAGKTTVMLKVFAEYHTNELLYHASTGQHVGHLLTHPDRRDLIVPGQYDMSRTNGGGLDFTGLRVLQDTTLMNRLWKKYPAANMLFEKVELAICTAPALRLTAEGVPLHMLWFVHPLPDRLISRSKRRIAKKTRDWKPTITSEFHLWDIQDTEQIRRHTEYLHTEHGIPMTKVTRETIFPTIMGLLS